MSSNVVDEKVVEMKFDNRNFEKNVEQSQRTIDKLMNSLKFKGASKGFEEINRSAKKVDFSNIGRGIDEVRLRFNALDIMQARIFSNIADSIQRTGVNLIKSLSVDQIASGWSKLNEKTASIQTIMNATGKSIDDVNGYLDRLMWFSDETSYSFTDMTSALAQMTSSGGDIDKLIPMITGIANATAFAGKGAREFSSTIRNLSQSYSSGHLNLIDMKSLDLMGTSSKQLKEAFIQAAESQGKIEKGSITIENFAETLQEQWADTEVMEEALGRFSALSEEAYKAVRAGEYDTASEAIEALSKTLREGSDEYDDLGEKAFKAAQEAKTFAEVIDATKDAVSSSWMESFNTIFGDYTQSKQLWTKMANEFWEIFTGGGEGRNEQLQNAFGSQWKNLKSIIESTGATVEDFEAALDKAISDTSSKNLDYFIDKYGDLSLAFENGAFKSYLIKYALDQMNTSTAEGSINVEKYTALMEDLENVVNRVVNGEFGHGDVRWNKLAEAGYNAMEVQELVNKTVWGQKIIWEDLTPEMMLAAGATEEEAEAMMSLKEAAEKAEIDLDELIASFDKMPNRQRIINAFGKILEHISNVMGAIRSGFAEAFDGSLAEGVTSFADGLERFADGLDNSKEHLDKIADVASHFGRIIRTVWGVVRNITKFATGVLKGIIKALGGDVTSLGDNILDCVDSILVWMDSNNFVSNSIQAVVDWITGAIDAVKNFIQKNEFLSKAIDKIGEIFEKIGEAGAQSTNIIDAISNIIVFIIQGLAQGILSIIDAAIDIGVNIGDLILEGINTSLSVNKPEKQGAEIGNSFVSKIIVAGKAAIDAIFAKLNEALPSVTEFIDNIRWGDIFASGIGVVILKVIANLSKSFAKVFDPIESLQAILNGFSGVLKGAKKALKGLKHYLDAEAFSAIADGVLKLAEAFAIIIGSIIILSSFDQKKLRAVGDIVIIVAGILGGLLILATVFTLVAGKMGFIAAGSMLAIGGTFLMIAGALESLMVVITLLGLFDQSTIDKGVSIFNGIGIMLLFILGASVLMVAAGTGGKIAALGFMFEALKGVIISIAAAMMLISTTNLAASIVGAVVIFALLLVLTEAVKNLAEIPTTGIIKAAAVIAILSGCMIALAFAMRIIGGGGKGHAAWGQWGRGILGMVIITALLMVLVKSLEQISTTPTNGILKATAVVAILSGCILLLAITMRLAAGNDWGTWARGVAGLVICVMALVGLLFAMDLLGKSKTNIPKVAGNILAMSVGILALALALRILENLKDPGKAILTLTGLVGEMAALVLSTRLIKEKEVADVAKNILAMSLAIGMLGVIMAILAWMSPEQIAKGLAVVYGLGGVVAGLVAVMNGTMKKGTHSFKSDTSALYALVALVGMFGLILIAVNFMDEQDIKEACAVILSIGTAIAGILASFSLVSKAGKVGWKPILQIMAIIGVVVLAIAGLSLILNNLNATDIIPKAIGLGIILTALVGAVAVISTVRKYVGGTGFDAIGPIIEIGAIALALFIVAEALNKLNPDGVLEKAAALTLIMISLTGMFAVLAVMSNMLTVAVIGGIAVMGALVGILYVLGLVLNEIMGMQNMGSGNLSSVVDNLIKVMLALTGMFVVLALFGPLAVPALAGTGALIAIVAAIGAALVGLGALAEKHPELETLVNSGIPLLVLVAQGIGQAVGAFINGISEAIAASIVLLGASLDVFATEMVVFSDTITKIDPRMVDSVVAVTEAILLLTAAEFVSAIGDLATLGLGKLSFAGNLIALVEAVGAVAAIADKQKITTGTAAKVRLIAEAGAAVGKMVNSMPLDGGLWDKIVGKNMNAEDLQSMLSAILTSVQIFSEQASTHNIDKARVADACEAGMSIMDLARAIPNEGGWLGKIMGENDAADFAEKMGGLAGGIVDFSARSRGINLDMVKKGTEAGMLINEMAKKLPNEGGWLGKIMGDNKMSDIGEELGDFAGAITAFGNHFLLTDIAKIQAAASAGLMVATMVDSFPTEGGLWNNIAGTHRIPDDIDTLLTRLAEGVVAFDEALPRDHVLRTHQMTFAAQAGIDIANMIASWPQSLPDEGAILHFTSRVNKMAQALVEYDTNIAGIDLDRITTSVSAIQNLNNATGVDGSGIQNFLSKIDLSSVGEKISTGLPQVESAVGDLTDTVNTALDPEKVNAKGKGFTVGYDYGMGILKGLNSQAVKGSLLTGLDKFITSISDAAGSGVGDFISIGERIDDGIVQGIKNRSHIVNNNLIKLINDAYKAGKDAAIIKSPSRLFRDGIGQYIPLGIAAGIEDYGWRVNQATEDVMVGSFNKAREQLSAIALLADESITAQPTIRPVVDLTDVRSSANDINRMFGTVTMMASGVGNVKSRNVLGMERDASFAKAIADIARTGKTGDTYTIGNVSYDSDSTVGRAVEELVRAIRLDRRS